MCSVGYPHDDQADNAAYRHDHRADERHDRRADSLSPLYIAIALAIRTAVLPLTLLNNRGTQSHCADSITGDPSLTVQSLKLKHMLLNVKCIHYITLH